MDMIWYSNELAWEVKKKINKKKKFRQNNENDIRDCFGKETVPLFKKNKGYILDKIYVLHKKQ